MVELEIDAAELYVFFETDLESVFAHATGGQRRALYQVHGDLLCEILHQCGPEQVKRVGRADSLTETLTVELSDQDVERYCRVVDDLTTGVPLGGCGESNADPRYQWRSIIQKWARQISLQETD